jgi:hypothetical protein
LILAAKGPAGEQRRQIRHQHLTRSADLFRPFADFERNSLVRLSLRKVAQQLLLSMTY